MLLKVVHCLSTANFWFLNSCSGNVLPRDIHDVLQSYQKVLFTYPDYLAVKVTTRTTIVRIQKLDRVNCKQSKAQTQTPTLAYAEQNALT